MTHDIRSPASPSSQGVDSLPPSATPLALSSSEEGALSSDGAAGSPKVTAAQQAPLPATPARCRAGEGADPSDQKICAHCEEPFDRDYFHSEERWRQRRYCSLACSSAATGFQKDAKRSDWLRKPPKDWRETVPSKVCGHCEKELRPLPEEKPSQWIGRKYCDSKCAARGRWDTPRAVGAILKEWPPEERFDRPGMVVSEKPTGFVRIRPHEAVERWI